MYSRYVYSFKFILLNKTQEKKQSLKKKQNGKEYEYICTYILFSFSYSISGDKWCDNHKSIQHN